MNGHEVRKLNDEEVSLEIRNLRSKLHTLRTQVVTEKVEDVSSFKQARRDVARLLTERNARLRASGKRVGVGSTTRAESAPAAKPAAAKASGAAKAPVKASGRATAKAAAKASGKTAGESGGSKTKASGKSSTTGKGKGK